MPLVQITYDVPLEIARGLAVGEFKLLGTAAVRNKTGIFAHIREISRTVSTSPVESAASRAGSAGVPRPMLLGFGVVALAAAGGVTGRRILKRRAAQAEAPQCLVNLNASMATYLDAIHNGDVSGELVRRVIVDLDVVKTCSQHADPDFVVFGDQLEGLVRLVADYTCALAKANDSPFAAAEDAPVGSKDALIIELRHSLGSQERIIGEVA